MAQAREPRRDLSFTEVWAALMELRESQKETAGADLRGDRREYVSSVSGALIEKEARNFTLESGIYVIDHPGERIQIQAPETVRAW